MAKPRASDSVQTPPLLAEQLVSLVPKTTRVTSVGDFGMGDGALLSAAHHKWPNAELIGIDLNPSVVRRMRSNPGWHVGLADFLDQRSISRSAVLRNARGRLSVILLNPPFTCRGHSRVQTANQELQTQCSVSTAFIVNALEFLAEDGVLVAIVPSGSLCSEKDADAWRQIESSFKIERLLENPRTTFRPLRIVTSVIRITRGRHSRRSASPKTPERDPDEVVISTRLVRGSVPMFQVSKLSGTQPLLHTTSLRGSSRLLPAAHVTKNPDIQGPCVFFPRVGAINKNKVIAFTGARRFVLSDCVIGMAANSKSEAITIHSRITSSWDEFASLYTGTGAPYITVKRVTEWLRQKNIVVE